jgi:hypothetical protein
MTDGTAEHATPAPQVPPPPDSPPPTPPVSSSVPAPSERLPLPTAGGAAASAPPAQDEAAPDRPSAPASVPAPAPAPAPAQASPSATAGPPPGRRGALAGPLALWAATRTVLLLCVFKVFTVPGPDVTSDVSGIYHNWYLVLRTGTFPPNDVTWQYPPAAALPVLSPGALPFLDYAAAFFVLVCATDALVLALLLYAARRPGRRPAGAWCWVAGVALLGPTAYARYDLMVTAVAVAALLAAAQHPRVAGALAAFGALLKAWPVLVLLGVRRGRATRRSWGAALLSGLVIALVVTATRPLAWQFLTAQRGRGTEVESLGSLVFHVARHHGWQGQLLFNYGSVEFVGPYVSLVSNVALALSGVAVGWLLLWRWRMRATSAMWTPACAADAAFTAVLLLTTTSRVISPQYMLWLVGAAAVCLTFRGTGQLPSALLVLAATGVTLLEFPLGFGHVCASDGRGVALLVVRNGLLVGASVVACARLWRSTVRGRAYGKERPARGGPGDSGGRGAPDADAMDREPATPKRPFRLRSAEGSGSLGTAGAQDSASRTYARHRAMNSARPMPSSPRIARSTAACRASSPFPASLSPTAR